MTTLTKLCAAAALAAAGLVSAAPGLQAAEHTLQLGHLANEDNSWHQGSLKFAEEVARLTEGRIEVEVFPNESLGRDMDLINGMQLGTVDMMIVGESLVNWAPMAALMAIPYGYASLEDMDAVASGEIGDQIEQEIIEKAQIRPLSYFARGPRNLTSNRPITTPEDLDGLKMRVPNVPLFVDVWAALGAQPTPMAFSEVFTSLQNGTIDAQENPLALIRSASFNEVQSHVNMTEHVRSWIYLAISELTWAQLSEADREAVMEAAALAQEHERKLFLQSLEDDRAWLEEHGMNFTEVDQKAFQQKAKDAVLSSVADEIRPIVAKLFED